MSHFGGLRRKFASFTRQWLFLLWSETHMRPFICIFVILAMSSGSVLAKQPELVEPTLHIATGGTLSPRVALTFDACMGKTDMRILSALIDNRLPATIFVTGRWLKYNRQAFEKLKAHPELFEIENHGAMHVPAVDRPTSVYGIKAAGSPLAVNVEVEGGLNAIGVAGGATPHWFRGSTARYNPSAIAQIRKLGFRVAGYSVNGDGGSLLGARSSERRIATARDGDVVIAHINQPHHSAGEGVVKGILDLKKKGFAFVKLSDVASEGSDGTTTDDSAGF